MIMFVAAIGKKQIGKVLLGVVAIVVVAVGAIYFLGKGKKGGSGTPIEGATPEQRESYLLSIGIQVDTTSSIAEVIVPKQFDERFTSYNNMLKTIGFDLEGLKGQTVKKCTYTVTNRSDIGTNISAVLLVYNDQIVAGHLIDNTTNTLYPLFEVNEDANQPDQDAKDTILPTNDEEEKPDEETSQEIEYPEE